jgi:KTSC domain
MKRDPVQSSNIESIGYDGKALTLEVKFHSGDVYQYANVPESIYKGLHDAESKGKYFHANIKDKYAFNKIEDKQK